MARRTNRKRRRNLPKLAQNQPNLTGEWIDSMAPPRNPIPGYQSTGLLGLPSEMPAEEILESFEAGGLDGVLQRQVANFNKIEGQFPDAPGNGLLGASNTPIEVIRAYAEHGIEIPERYQLPDWGNGLDGNSGGNGGAGAQAQAIAPNENDGPEYMPTDPTAWREQYWDGDNPKSASQGDDIFGTDSQNTLGGGQGLPGFESTPHPQDIPTPTLRPDAQSIREYDPQVYNGPNASIDRPGSAPLRANVGVGSTSQGDMAAIENFAREWGINRVSLAGKLNIESGIDPTKRGGGGNNYHGISQIEGQQIPNLTERAGLGRMSPDQYRQLGVEDQLKVTDQYYRQYGIKPSDSFFTGDSQKDTARLWGMQLAPSRAVAGEIDFDNPNAVISATDQTDRIEARQGLVTVGSVVNATINEGLGVINNIVSPMPRDQSIAQDVGEIPNAAIDAPGSLGYQPAPDFAPTGRRNQKPESDILAQTDVLAKTMYGPDYGFTAFAGQEPPSAMLAGSRLNHPRGHAADGYLTYRGQPVQDRQQAAEFLQGVVAANKDASIGFGDQYMTRAGYPNAANMHVQENRGLAWGNGGRVANIDPQLKSGIDSYRGSGQLPRNYLEDERFTPTPWNGGERGATPKSVPPTPAAGFAGDTPPAGGGFSPQPQPNRASGFAGDNPPISTGRSSMQLVEQGQSNGYSSHPWADLADDSVAPSFKSSYRPDAQDPRGTQTQAPQYKTITSYETRYRDVPIEARAHSNAASNANQSAYEMEAYGPMESAAPEKPKTRREAYQVAVPKRVRVQTAKQSIKQPSALDRILTRNGAVKSKTGTRMGGALGAMIAGIPGALAGRAIGNQAGVLGSGLAQNYANQGGIHRGGSPNLSGATNVGSAKAVYSAPPNAGNVYGYANNGNLVTQDHNGWTSVTNKAGVTTTTIPLATGGVTQAVTSGGGMFGGDTGGGGGK